MTQRVNRTLSQRRPQKLGPLAIQLSLLLAAAIVSGCLSKRNDDAPPGDPNSLVAISDDPRDLNVTKGLPGKTEHLEIIKVLIQERTEVVNVTFVLAENPDIAQGSYQISFYSPNRQTRAGASVGEDGVGPAGVSYFLGARTISIHLPYSLLYEITDKLDYRFYARTNTWRANGQAWDEVPFTDLKWSRIRITTGGFGPFWERTAIVDDPCCDLDYLGFHQPKSHPSGDLRGIWLWQDQQGLWFESNTTDPATDEEWIELRYPGKNSPSHESVSYDFATNSVSKQGNDTGALGAKTQNNGVRFRIPWAFLADRAASDSIRLTVTVWTEAAEGTYADAAPAIHYRTT